ncbi:MAG: GntR family transcriptional regulator [Actinocatenispora sp.]
MSQGYTTGGALPELPDITADPLATRLAEIIREVRPGGRLPSERDLAIRLGVSRTALRDRLRSLETAGILRRRSGSGTYVEPVNPDAVTRTLSAAVNFSDLPVDSLFSALDALDRQAVREAAVRADRAAIDRLSATLDGMRDIAQPGGAMAAHHRFHEIMVEVAANPAVQFLRAGVVGSLREAGLLWPNYKGDAPLVVPAGLYERHRRICHSVAKHDPAAAMLAFD